MQFRSGDGSGSMHGRLRYARRTTCGIRAFSSTCSHGAFPLDRRCRVGAPVECPQTLYLENEPTLTGTTTAPQQRQVHEQSFRERTWW